MDTRKRVNNKVALTGEIDLCKNVTAIGGVYAKLNGAKRAGVTKALIPQENMEDLERLRRENISPEDENFVVKPIASAGQSGAGIPKEIALPLSRTIPPQSAKGG